MKMNNELGEIIELLLLSCDASLITTEENIFTEDEHLIYHELIIEFLVSNSMINLLIPVSLAVCTSKLCVCENLELQKNDIPNICNFHWNNLEYYKAIIEMIRDYNDEQFLVCIASGNYEGV